MNTLIILIVVGVVAAACWVLFFWFQNRRAEQANQRIDHSKLNDLDNDGWND